ncbi:thiamine biosynthesis lipoprotein [Aliiroseovarius sediminilitoris]|uniref:FAD:protein FMN transferase n=1 Tax=Aliiroseovarius sediminilitoris TaxID=1173584 RepID=A0A1I0R9Z1_9RHOB|nr:FAD:protein FMN transferase [Aliiroseovarius sediminilitoris]SEW37408.1 thiamine biosynthesis lipoprotein [Aliiroseovarius sediminilitoris]
MSILNRRRFLAISATALAVPTGVAASAHVARWTGYALGGPVSMQLVGVAQPDADLIFTRVEAELDRLEDIFSLYRDNSELSRLNRFGALVDPSAEFLHVLSACASLHAASKGQFDPTVQPLWLAIANDADDDTIAAAKALVGWSNVTFDANQIRLPTGGALTLNGIAQGAVTDRIAALLRGQGLQDVLVDMGEIAALGQGPNGPWSIGVAKTDGTLVHRLTATDRAIATSVPTAMEIGDTEGHILSPTGGAPVQALVSVSAPTAMIADGLSTALCLVDDATGKKIVAAFPDAKIEVMTSV